MGIFFAHLLNRSQVAFTSTAAQEGFTSSRTHGSWRGAVCSDWTGPSSANFSGKFQGPRKNAAKSHHISHTISHSPFPNRKNLSEIWVLRRLGRFYWGFCREKIGTVHSKQAVTQMEWMFGDGWKHPFYMVKIRFIIQLKTPTIYLVKF